MNVRWNEDVPGGIKTVLLSSMKKNIQKNIDRKSKKINKNEDLGHKGNIEVGLNIQGMSNILYGLGNMGFYWRDYDKDIKEKIIIFNIQLYSQMEKKYSKKNVRKIKNDSDEVVFDNGADYDEKDIENNDNFDGNFDDIKTNKDSIWKNKKNEKINLNFDYDNDIINDNDVNNYTYLLKSLSVIKFDIEDEFKLCLNNPNNYKDLVKFKDLVLTLFVQFSEHNDNMKGVDINNENHDSKTHRSIFEHQDFALCFRSIGTYLFTCTCIYK